MGGMESRCISAYFKFHLAVLTTNSAAWFHTAMALFVIVSGGGIVVLFCEWQN